MNMVGGWYEVSVSFLIDDDDDDDLFGFRWDSSSSCQFP